jgi:hypothetical protein
MSEKVSDAITANLVRAAGDFGYEVARQIRDGGSENARALAQILADDPAAEFIVSICTSPRQRVVVAIVTSGRPYVAGLQTAKTRDVSSAARGEAGRACKSLHLSPTGGMPEREGARRYAAKWLRALCECEMRSSATNLLHRVP